MKNINVLTRCGIKPSIPILLALFQIKWITQEEVIQNIIDYHLLKEDDIMKLCVEENFYANFISISENYTRQADIQKNAQIILLFDVKNNNNLSIDEKLTQIAELWAFFDYPNEWESFIYYMPNEAANSSKDVYKIFEDFVNAKFKLLNFQQDEK